MSDSLLVTGAAERGTTVQQPLPVQAFFDLGTHVRVFDVFEKTINLRTKVNLLVC